MNLYEEAKKELEKKPYIRFGLHKDLKGLTVVEEDESEFTYFIEKFWLTKYVGENYKVENLQKWLENEYTSEESEEILFKGIEAGVIAGVERT